ncbi:hypothetical protein ACH5RR_029463 [Cinchona calisaya]|uniref:Uncharacterized protein n=1 Tax=Cinchona calisaya TaxID=153742 RepID=A0ABD2YW61_9GENT
MAHETIESSQLANLNTEQNMPATNNPHFQPYEAAFPSQFDIDDHGSERLRIAPVTNLPKLLCHNDGNQNVEKKKYRHEAIRRWKTKRLQHTRLALQPNTNLSITQRNLNSLPKSSQEYTLMLELAESIAKLTITCFVRYYEQDNQGHREVRYIIVKAYTTEELLEATHVLTNQESISANSKNTAIPGTTPATVTIENVGPSILPLPPAKKPATTFYAAEATS